MAVDIVDPISKYTIETPVWEIEVAPGKTEVLNGTVQEIYSRALAINPNFQQVPTARSIQELETSLVEKRATTVKCGNWPSAERRRIHEGIAYLRTLTAAPRMPPGPGACFRVSCSYGAAIYWCNDVSSHVISHSPKLCGFLFLYAPTPSWCSPFANHPRFALSQNKTWKNLDNWDMIANSAGFIIFSCAPEASYVSGQNFESGNWNTIVRGDSC